MEKDFVELLKKKKAEQGDKPMDSKKMQAKAGVVKDLMTTLKDLMANDIKGLKKVTVAADTKEGLKEGLEKAEEIIEKNPAELEASEDEENDKSEEKSEDEKIAELEKQLQELKAKKSSPSMF